MRYETTNQWFQLLALVVFGVLLFATPLASAQQQQAESTNVNSAPVATNNATPNNTQKTPPIVIPVFTNYKEITIGMRADEVRQKLDHLKEKGAKQDFFVFSDAESAQVFYDDQGLVKAISVDYRGNDSGAPDAMSVLGVDIPANAKGVMHKLVRYSEANYWVSYNRTAGSSPIVTVTMQRIRKRAK